MDFQTVLLEGLFYLSAERELFIRTDTGEVISVEVRLQPLLGRRVQLALHHFPFRGLDPTAWGCGSCQWKPAECPAGHHLRPQFLFSFSGNGVLRRNPWVLDLPAGGSSFIDMSMMPGHTGRLAVAEFLNWEENLVSPPEMAELGRLGDTVEGLRDMVKRLTTQGAKFDSTGRKDMP